MGIGSDAESLSFIRLYIDGVASLMSRPPAEPADETPEFSELDLRSSVVKENNMSIPL
jgi:hypothetical protein